MGRSHLLADRDLVHIREYTKDELIKLFSEFGAHVVEVYCTTLRLFRMEIAKIPKFMERFAQHLFIVVEKDT